MSDKSKIEWTDTTWNPVTGCTKVSAGCKHCYAKYGQWPRLSANPKTVYFGRKFEEVQVNTERLDDPLHWRKPRRIFVNSMSDLFHEDIPDEFIASVFNVMATAKQHIYQILTKRPKRMYEWISRCKKSPQGWVTHNGEDPNGYGGCGKIVTHPIFDESKRFAKVIDDNWPLPNVWLGVSVEDQETADSRLTNLVNTPACVRFISAEPLLGPIKFRDEIFGLVDQIIVGGESGPKARPMHPAWVSSIRDQCIVAGVPFFFKQWGEWAPKYYFDSETKKRLLKISVNKKREIILDDLNMLRVGKKKAGRLLDGKEWNEYPLRQ